MPRSLTLGDALFSQGFGTRRECAALAYSGAVQVAGVRLDDPATPLAREGLVLRVHGRDWPYAEHALILLHKPAGYECSQRPSAWPSVLTLLPVPLRQRGVQPVGRLDQDTTGLLLLTDDGALLRRFTSPRQHVPKVYEALCAEPVDAIHAQRLCEGVVLHDDPAPVRVVRCEVAGTHMLRLTLAEGKYHQVKRMVAALGNRVVALHRCAFGALVLPADLAPGNWRWLAGPHEVVGA